MQHFWELIIVVFCRILSSLLMLKGPHTWSRLRITLSPWNLGSINWAAFWRCTISQWAGRNHEFCYVHVEFCFQTGHWEVFAVSKYLKHYWQQSGDFVSEGCGSGKTDHEIKWECKYSKTPGQNCLQMEIHLVCGEGGILLVDIKTETRYDCKLRFQETEL